MNISKYQCCGSGILSRIPICTHSGSRISDPKTKTKERCEKKLVVNPFFVATNFTKLKLFYFLNAEEKTLGQFSKNYRTFTQKFVPKL
jgi:hypothetical protein